MRRRVADELEMKSCNSVRRRSPASSPNRWSARRSARSPPVPGYFKRIREICDRHGVLLILDEVMCGMGRTGTRYVANEEGIAPDLMSIAKGLGGGYQPIGAVLIHHKIADAVAAGLRAFFSTGTPIWLTLRPALPLLPCSASSMSRTCLQRSRGKASS